MTSILFFAAAWAVGLGSMPLSSAAPLKESFAFPNPVVGRRVPVIRAALGPARSVKVRIYDSEGRIIHDASFSGIPSGTDRSGVSFYDYAWKDPVASGVYYYAVLGQAADDSFIGAYGKITVTR